MRFGRLPLGEAEGAIAAHTVRLDGSTIKKGTRLTAETLDALQRAGRRDIIAARLEPSDVHEDEAAYHVALAIAGQGIVVEAPATGRSNLFSRAAGLFRVDPEACRRINRIDPGLTLATLRDLAPVEAGRMVATVKIIPFALDRAGVEAAAAVGPLIDLLPFQPLRVGLVATQLAGTKEQVLAKTRRVLDDRLAPAGARIVKELRVAHDTEAIAAALADLAKQDPDLLIVFGASAITDRRDVIPTAVEAAGGEVLHFGMPVDPGNLLLFAQLAGKPLLGAPGCARSPKENGFDWVLQRLLAGLEVTAEDITDMGVGGLLMEIVSRPRPRLARDGHGIAAIVLAAGRSRRMGRVNKLLATIDGVPLVRRVVEAALAGGLEEVVVVTGHESERIREALHGLGVRFVQNPDYEEGLSTSVRVGAAALQDAAGAMVMLGDMPRVEASHVRMLIEAFAPGEGGGIVVATASGKRGNPVLFAPAYLTQFDELAGDTGAKALIGRNEEDVVEVEIGEAAALDLDTPEMLAAAGGVAEEGGKS